MTKFALLLHHTPDRYTNLSEDDFMAIMKDYIAWIEKATSEGVYEGGYKLSSEGKTITSNNNNLEVHHSPFAEISEIMGGFMLINANNLEHAVQIANSHPHLVHNSKIEVRQIDGD